MIAELRVELPNLTIDEIILVIESCKYELESRNAGGVWRQMR